MSAREPMWYCHECNAEMRPLMAPDPHCASCNGTFVEKMDDPTDDPREFHNAPAFADGPMNPFELLAGLHDILRSETPESDRSSPSEQRSTGPRNRTGNSQSGITFEFSGPSGGRRFLIGGANTLGRRASEERATPPRLSEFLHARGPDEHAQPNEIPSQLMAQYIMSLLGGTAFGARGASPFLPLGMLGSGADGPAEGRLGDYVFTQEALDQIITQIMEGANSSRPVPAPEDVVEQLRRDVLEADSPLLEKECAVCKDQFTIQPENPEEEVVVTLPCKHPFHETCILPWLKSSGTCPVCRFALVPQPNNHAAGPGPPGPSSSSSSPHSSSGAGSSSPRGGSSPQTDSTSGAAAGVGPSSPPDEYFAGGSGAGDGSHRFTSTLSNLFHGHRHNTTTPRGTSEQARDNAGPTSESSSSRRPHAPRSSESRRASANRRDDHYHILPGGWWGPD